MFIARLGVPSMVNTGAVHNGAERMRKGQFDTANEGVDGVTPVMAK